VTVTHPISALGRIRAVANSRGSVRGPCQAEPNELLTSQPKAESSGQPAKRQGGFQSPGCWSS
jgi:hypothetical protein